MAAICDSYGAYKAEEVLAMRVDLVIKMLGGRGDLRRRAQAGMSGPPERPREWTGVDGVKRVRMSGGVEELKAFLSRKM